MKIVVRVVFLCGLAGFGCLSVLAQEWPISPDPYPTGSKVDKPIYATIDIADDMWRSKSRFSRDNMASLMQYLAKIGVSRVYWLRAPEYMESNWFIPAEGRKMQSVSLLRRHTMRDWNASRFSNRLRQVC